MLHLLVKLPLPQMLLLRLLTTPVSAGLPLHQLQQEPTVLLC